MGRERKAVCPDTVRLLNSLGTSYEFADFAPNIKKVWLIKFEQRVRPGGFQL